MKCGAAEFRHAKRGGPVSFSLKKFQNKRAAFCLPAKSGAIQGPFSFPATSSILCFFAGIRLSLSSAVEWMRRGAISTHANHFFDADTPFPLRIRSMTQISPLFGLIHTALT